MFVAESLAAAFADDAAFTALFPADTAQALAAWFAAVVEVFCACDLARLAIRGHAAAIWTTGDCPARVERLDDRLFEVINRYGGPGGVEFAAAISEAADTPAPGSWVLHWIGTPHADRRAGHGRRLLSHILRDAAEAGAPLWTTTTNPAAVRLYTGLGMVARAERAVAGRAGLNCWTLSSGGS